jgi:DNA-directed RNA polymerase subunit RPC12/RpoP
MSKNRVVPLKVIDAPAVGPVVSAPPVLKASDHTVDYTCGKCGALLLHAEDNQVHNLQIHCLMCGSYNSTD